jgi:hypothetical protein
LTQTANLLYLDLRIPETYTANQEVHMAITLERTRKYGTAKRLGIEGYRNLTDAQLDAAIAKASKPAAKGKTATVSKGKTAAKVSTPAAKGKTVAKGKTATAPAAKSTARKSTPRASAAKGKVTRQSGTARTTAARKPATKPAVRKPAAKAPVKRTAAKAAPANGTRRAPISKDKGTRNFLDIKSIDWKAESTVGQSGKRKDVLDALRRYKGNYGKVFELLAPKARVYYRGKTKAQAEALLRWLIARVAFDFAVNTDQHEMGARREYGTAGTNGSTPKPAARKAVAKATGRKPAQKPAAAKRTTTRAKATPAARKPAQSRTAAPKGKRGGKVTAGRR